MVYLHSKYIGMNTKANSYCGTETSEIGDRYGYPD
jgi:hypothetical protein